MSDVKPFVLDFNLLTGRCDSGKVQPTARYMKDLVKVFADSAVAEAMADPQTEHRKALAEVYDDAGSFKVLNLPFRMSSANPSPNPRVARLGEHTKTVLQQAGYSDEDIARFGAR